MCVTDHNKVVHAWIHADDFGLSEFDRLGRLPSSKFSCSSIRFAERSKAAIFHTQSLGSFEGVRGKGVYAALVKVRNFAVLKEVKKHQWQGHLEGQAMSGFRWGVLYKLPVPKRSGDLQFRLLHKAPIVSCLQRIKMEGEGVCNIAWICTSCVWSHCLLSLLSLLSAICGKMGVGFSEGSGIVVRLKTEMFHWIFLFSLAKLASWLMRFRAGWAWVIIQEAALWTP